MKYLVMETHPAYAVLLDEEGRFVRAANFRYQVGQKVEDAVLLREPAGKRDWVKPVSGAVTAAACLALTIAGYFGYYAPNFTAYGTLRMEINPSVQMTLSETGRVLDLDGLNADGETLAEGYDYQGKNRSQVAEELVERAIEMGFLSDGDTVSISVSSRDSRWQDEAETETRDALEAAYGEWIVIRLDSDPLPEEEPVEPEPEEIVIPIPQPESSALPPESVPESQPEAPPAVEEDDDDDDDVDLDDDLPAFQPSVPAYSGNDDSRDDDADDRDGRDDDSGDDHADDSDDQDDDNWDDREDDSDDDGDDGQDDEENDDSDD